MKLALDANKYDIDDIASGAQEVWCRCFGKSRVSGAANRRTHSHKGTPQKRKSRPTDSEAAFTRAVRACRRTGADDVESVRRDIQNLPMAIWTADHEKEMKFAEDKIAQKRVQALDGACKRLI